jgi:hypothetical protein
MKLNTKQANKGNNNWISITSTFPPAESSFDASVVVDEFE